MPNETTALSPESIAEKFVKFETAYRQHPAARQRLVDGLNLWQKDLAVEGRIDLAFGVVSRAGELFLQAQQTRDFGRLLKSALILARRAMKAEDKARNTNVGAQHRLLASNILGWIDRGYKRINGGCESEEHAEILEFKAKVDAKFSDSFAAVSAGGVCQEVSAEVLAFSSAVMAGRLNSSARSFAR